MILTVEDVLNHSGVKGMKWGVRKSSSSSAPNPYNSKFHKQVMRENYKSLSDIYSKKQINEWKRTGEKYAKEHMRTPVQQRQMLRRTAGKAAVAGLLAGVGTLAFWGVSRKLLK